MFFRKNNLKEEPLKYWEEKSFMLAIPDKSIDKYIPGLYTRISKIKKVKIIDTTPIELNKPGTIKLNYKDKYYEVEIYPSIFSLPDIYINKSYYFTEEEIKKIKNAKDSLTISMKFSDNPKDSYHLQIKISVAIIPDLIGVIDESAEKLLPPEWVKMLAESDITESASDLYTIQAIYNDNNEVWLHTHGLNRCGLTELEILNSNRINYNNHYHLINTYANYLIDKIEDKNDPRDSSAYIGMLINRQPIVVTCLSWTKALKYYKKIKIGNIKDRKENHNGKSSVIFIYKSEEDENNKKISKINDYDNLLQDNPIFFINNNETTRMSLLAKERFNFVREQYKNKENKILIKIGLPVPEEYGSLEHIWFELIELKNNKFKARLTQEPYNVKDIHEGYESWYTINDITDWIIYTKEFTITPNNAYILKKY